MSRLVDVPPQRVYGSVPLLLPLLKMSEAEATWLYGQPQIYDKDYPLDYDGTGLNPPWWAGTGAGGELNGLSGVGGGNVRLLPGETGFGAFGLTAAQAKAQAVAAARKNAVAAAKASGQKPAAAAKAGAQAAVAARQSLSTPAATTPAASQPAQSAVVKVGTPATPKTPTATQQAAAAKKACIASGGAWDPNSNSCGKSAKQIACEAQSGTWANNVCTQNPAYSACINANPPGAWANGACTPGVVTPPTCPTGQTYDATQKTCVPGLPLVPTCPAGQMLNASNACVPSTTQCTYSQLTSCPTGQIIGTGPDGCPACVTDPNYNSQSAQIAQCQQGGGYWNGTYCAPPAQGAYGGGGGGGIPPSLDSGGGAFPPPPIQDNGGGFPMTQDQSGPGPQLNDQAFNIPTPDSDSSDQSSGGDGSDNTDTGSTDDTSKVADTNIFESISKLFSGMNGLACGCNAAPTWFGVSGLGKSNAPPLESLRPQYYTAINEQPIKPSTMTAVVGGAVVLMVGAAAIFLWSKGTRK